VDSRFVRTKVAARGHIDTGTFQAECCGESLDRRAKQSRKGFQTLGGFWHPGYDEITAGPELAQRLGLSFSIWFHLLFQPYKILQIRSVANVLRKESLGLSAGHDDLPKQKPNKNQPNQHFFFVFGFRF